MGVNVPIPLSIRGPLDTALEPHELPPGGLVVAQNLGHLYWGPRRPRSRIATLNTNYAGRTDIIVADGVDDVITFRPYAAFSAATNEYPDTGHRWTLDIIFEMVTLASTDDNVLWEMKSARSTSPAISVYLEGTAAAAGDQGKVSVDLRTDSGAVLSAVTTLTGTTQITGGAGAGAVGDMHHIRIVRDGAEVTLYLDGTSEATSSALSALDGCSYSTMTMFRRAAGTTANTFFNGRVCYVSLRKGVYTDMTQRFFPLPFPRSSNVLFAAVGGRRSLPFSLTFCEDFSRFGAHGVISGNPNALEASDWPNIPAVLGIGSFVDSDNIRWNVVNIGGQLFTDHA